jgi:hypothetical protein
MDLVLITISNPAGVTTTLANRAKSRYFEGSKNWGPELVTISFGLIVIYFKNIFVS